MGTPRTLHPLIRRRYVAIAIEQCGTLGELGHQNGHELPGTTHASATPANTPPLMLLMKGTRGDARGQNKPCNDDLLDRLRQP